MNWKKYLFTVLVLGMTFNITGCIKPPRVEMIRTIETNETAFLVPMEGKTKAGQAQFMSLEYLEDAKVATKRVSLPQREQKIGRFAFQIKWIPTMKVIKVDRTPVTREWTSDDKTGTSKVDQAIWVESKDSIGFAIGVNITALITEDNAATFLYYYAGKPLSNVIDENIRGLITAVLSREFGNRDLTKCKIDKKEISSVVLSEAKESFSKKGITIENLGLVGGLTYEDKEIQTAINEAYVAEMDIKKAEMQKDAQIAKNEKKVSIAIAERKSAEEFAKAKDAMVLKTQLEIEMIRANKWNGEVPRNIVPSNSQFLFSLNNE